MKTKYIDLIEQTFDWPQEEFGFDENGMLTFHGVSMDELVKEYGTPLKFHYLPKIGENIRKARTWFTDAMKKHDYDGEYNYCYVTKSSHFRFVLEEAVKAGAHIEISSPFDLEIVRSLFESGTIKADKKILCNGFKQQEYLEKIVELHRMGMTNIMPILDNEYEPDYFAEYPDVKMNVGIRIATEEEPKFEFYTSRLGVGYKRIMPFYYEMQENCPNLTLKMLHFFVNTGIRDTAYYWNELLKALRVYCQLKRECPTLDSLNIGGGFPIKNSLAFEYDFEYLTEAIIEQIKWVCEEEGVPLPHIYTEFGSFTVGESGGMLYKVLHQKQQNDREKWNMIDSSFMTTLPDTWSISKRFVMLPINGWDREYERVFLGGLTCDSDDYYNAEQHINAIYLPKYTRQRNLYIGFFNTGAYQESIGGYGGVHHCLIPGPRHVLIDRDVEGNVKTWIFREKQTSEEMLSLLGYPFEGHSASGGGLNGAAGHGVATIARANGDLNGAHVNGTHTNGAHANGAHANGESNANGAHTNDAHANGESNANSNSAQFTPSARAGVQVSVEERLAALKRLTVEKPVKIRKKKSTSPPKETR